MSKRSLPLLGLLLASISTAPVWAQYTVDQNSVNKSPVNTQLPLQVELMGVGKQLNFEHSARLVDVLKQAQQQDIMLEYPLATTLFDQSEQAKRSATKLKNSVLNRMIQHNLVSHPLYKFIQSHQFAPRLLSAVDIDNVRLNKQNNPLLNGELALVAPKREEHVFYLGNLDKVYSVKAQAGIALEQQLINLEQDIDELEQDPVLIYPDGNVVEPHHGSWLNTQYYLPPLTMVYVPFEAYATSELDQDIVTLLTQLSPQQKAQVKPQSQSIKVKSPL
ncbi:capsule biosynthesis GfcC family protein [Vibrio mytili]|uniref:capsule biosynthesis GfcC D2 domain-containing protein n=1 Tax=Vibrio mytili TaxID=50718 RepID=UPI002F415DE2